MTDKLEVPRALLDHSTLTMVQPHVHPLQGQVPGREPVLGPTPLHVHHLVESLHETACWWGSGPGTPNGGPVTQWLSRIKVT